MDNKLKHIIMGIALSALLFFVFGIPTALVQTGIYKRMIPPTIADYALLAIISVLAGSYVSYSLYLKGTRAEKSGFAALGGTITGFLGFVCPVCSSLLVFAFGYVALLSFFEPYRHYLFLPSIALFSAAFYMKHGRCGRCSAKK